MEAVTLMPDGRLLSGTTESAVEQTDILPCLSSCLRLEQGCTLRSFFSMIDRHPILVRLNPFLETARHEAAQCPKTECVTADFTALEFAKTVELTGAPGEPIMNVFTMFRGISADQLQPGTGEIRFHRLSVLLDMPICLGRLRHVVFGDRNSMLVCDTSFTLFEIIEGIAWELGFQGGSQQCSLRR